MIASGCQYAIVYEDKQLRGRLPGELINIVEQAFIDAGFDSGAFEKIADEGQAIERRLERALARRRPDPDASSRRRLRLAQRQDSPSPLTRKETTG